MLRDESARPQPYARPVQRAYEQVADQMRQWILSGVVAVGDQLPTEGALAERFGTSRSTVREALRLLSSENLITTRPGARGGSRVSQPDPGRITDSLQTSLALLVGTSELSLTELLAARKIMEIPATTLAATNRDDDHLATLATLLPDRPADMDPDRLFQIDRAFHETLLRASGNRLLPLIVSPVYQVMSRRFRRNRAAPEFWDLVVDQHREIFRAVSEQNAEAAAIASSKHLDDLARTYRLIDGLAEGDATS
jgi:GntR family transcriptional repressor for pyruvate dehydrogenase complex